MLCPKQLKLSNKDLREAKVNAKPIQMAYFTFLPWKDVL